MSVTTTANRVSGTVLQALTDYDLHHPGQAEQPRTPEAPNTRPSPAEVIENPENWDNEHRRVPPYRPVDQSLYGPERPGGVNPVEMTLIYVMLHGEGLVAVSLNIAIFCDGRADTAPERKCSMAGDRREIE